ncbi:MAG: glycine cleavage system protein T [Chloroflexi bacterium]|nr:glycine cleavage system protein T [Chloroflexota bacterium]
MWYRLDDFLGRVRMSGASRLDFVQRMSTGDVMRLQSGEGVTTVFTTPIGRIVDYTRVLSGADSLLLLTGGGNQDKLLRWLRKYIFFNDDVQLADETARTSLAAVFDEDLPDEVRALPLHGHFQRDGVTWVRCALGTRHGAWVIFDGPLPEKIVSCSADAAAFEVARVAAGEPRFPNELGEDFIPLEAGVWDAVSFRKGCYVGQEVLARMESRGQIARRLARLYIVPDVGAVAIGDELMADGQPCGRVTSVAGDAALGYVRSLALEIGRELVAGAGRVRVEALAGRTASL